MKEIANALLIIAIICVFSWFVSNLFRMTERIEQRHKQMEKTMEQEALLVYPKSQPLQTECNISGPGYLCNSLIRLPDETTAIIWRKFDKTGSLIR